MGRRPFLLFLAAAAMFAACEDDFSPKSDFNRQLAVFAVLDPAMTVQTVRLEWSYDAAVGAISSPLTETEVAEAEVKIVQAVPPSSFPTRWSPTPRGRGCGRGSTASCVRSPNAVTVSR